MDSPDPIDIQVGARIRVRRMYLGMTQRALAASVNITFQQLQKYERAANRVSASMLVRVAAELKTTVAALVGEDDRNTEHTRQIGPFKSLKGAHELLDAYASLRDHEVQCALVTLVKSMAQSKPDSH